MYIFWSVRPSATRGEKISQVLGLRRRLKAIHRHGRKTLKPFNPAYDQSLVVTLDPGCFILFKPVGPIPDGTSRATRMEIKDLEIVREDDRERKFPRQRDHYRNIIQLTACGTEVVITEDSCPKEDFYSHPEVPVKAISFRRSYRNSIVDISGETSTSRAFRITSASRGRRS